MLFTLQAYVNKVFHKLNSLHSKGSEGATGQGGLVLAASQLKWREEHPQSAEGMESSPAGYVTCCSALPSNRATVISETGLILWTELHNYSSVAGKMKKRMGQQ